MNSGSLHSLLTVGARLKTTHPNFAKHGITEVVYLGTQGTTSGKYHLIGGIKPDGSKKNYNFSKMKIESGKADKHFEFIPENVSYSSSLKITKGEIPPVAYGEIHVHNKSSE